MTDNRKQHFDALTQPKVGIGKSGIWELPDHICDEVSGAADFAQGNNFAQNFACFAQGVGNFSQGMPPRNAEQP